MCEHLSIIEKELNLANVEVTFRGQNWSKGSREWVYFDCVLDTDSLRERHQLPSFIKIHTNDDNKSGLEHGIVCSMCQDAIMGIHPKFGKGKIIFK